MAGRLPQLRVVHVRRDHLRRPYSLRTDTLIEKKTRREKTPNLGEAALPVLLAHKLLQLVVDVRAVRVPGWIYIKQYKNENEYLG